MMKKVIFVLFLFLVLGASAFYASEYLGVAIPVVTDLIDSAQPSTDADVVTDQIDSTQSNTDAVPSETDSAASFSPDLDGYNFRNYSGRFPEGNMTIHEARAMFGDEVCTRLEGDTCIPHPKVLAWLDSMNETMNEVGHCVGFTVSSKQLHSEIRSVAELGADTTFALERETPVLRTISQAYSSYYASNVWAEEVRGKTPTEIIDALLELDAPVDIGIFQPEYGRNGHSILGHDVVDKGDGIYHIAVYDSNRPGKDNVIVVDTTLDTWFYADGAVNPDQPSSKYQGSAETKSLTFLPISAYNQPLECPADFAELCPAISDTRFSVLTLFGRGQALAETEDGMIGQSGDTLINTVPDGLFVPVRGELYSRQAPLMLIPDSEAFELQAQSNQADEALRIAVANPTYSIVIDGLVGQPGQIEQLTFDPANRELSFVAGGPQQPLIQLIFDQDGAVYSVQIAGLQLEAGQDLTATVDANNGDLQMTSAGLVINDAVILVARLTSAEEAVFANQNASFTPGAVQALDLDSWDGSGAMNFLVDEDGDGTFESTTPLTNEPVADVLPAIGAADTIFESLQNTLPYLGDTQTSAVAAVLPTLGFTAAELGSTYLQLPALQSNSLADTITPLDLAPKEMAHFLLALGLDMTDISEMLNYLQLPPSSKSAVEMAVEKRLELFDTLDEWDFLNTDDPKLIEDFLADQDLPDDQVDEFLALASSSPETGISDHSERPTSTTRPTPDSTTQPTPTAAVEPTPTSVVATNELGGECSAGSPVENSTTFVNETDDYVTTIWVNEECADVEYETLAPGDSYTQESFVGDPWRVRSEESGELMPMETPLGLVLTYINDGTGNVTVIVRR